MHLWQITFKLNFQFLEPHTVENDLESRKSFKNIRKLVVFSIRELCILEVLQSLKAIWIIGVLKYILDDKQALNSCKMAL